MAEEGELSGDLVHEAMLPLDLSSGLYYRTRKRWPFTPYRGAALLGKPIKRADIA